MEFIAGVHSFRSIPFVQLGKLKLMSSSRAPSASAVQSSSSSSSSVTSFPLFRHGRLWRVTLLHCFVAGGCLYWFSTVAAAPLVIVSPTTSSDDDSTAAPRLLSPLSMLIAASLSVVVKFVGRTLLPLLLAACFHYVAWQLYLRNV